LGRIDNSVVFIVSNVPVSDTSILSGPFSTLAVVGLLPLKDEGAADATGLGAGFSAGF
jgi:hypothetical protein